MRWALSALLLGACGIACGDDAQIGELDLLLRVSVAEETLAQVQGVELSAWNAANGRFINDEVAKPRQLDGLLGGLPLDIPLDLELRFLGAGDAELAWGRRESLTISAGRSETPELILVTETDAFRPLPMLPTPDGQPRLVAGQGCAWLLDRSKLWRLRPGTLEASVAAELPADLGTPQGAAVGAGCSVVVWAPGKAIRFAAMGGALTLNPEALTAAGRALSPEAAFGLEDGRVVLREADAWWIVDADGAVTSLTFGAGAGPSVGLTASGFPIGPDGLLLAEGTRLEWLELTESGAQLRLAVDLEDGVELGAAAGIESGALLLLSELGADTPRARIARLRPELGRIELAEASLLKAREGAALMSRRDGRIRVIGGRGPGGELVRESELVEIEDAEGFAVTRQPGAALQVGRFPAQVGRLPSGRVLVAGPSDAGAIAPPCVFTPPENLR